MKKFALTGVSGFVAERHLEAIRSTGNELVAAMDVSDSAGILDSYFPCAEFFTGETEFEKFLRLYKKEKGLDYLSVCTPNHLHQQNVRSGLDLGVSVICEKPLVLEPDDAEELLRIEQRSDGRVFNILQLRHHPDILALKKNTLLTTGSKYDIDLAYVTPRGKWYHHSWKGDEARSGGIATNIGIHFFDMLIWIYGPVKDCIIHMHTDQRAAGFLELEHARVRWFLSINEDDLPAENKPGRTALRSIMVNGDVLDFSSGFAQLHNKNYEAILSGRGCGIQDVMPSIELAHQIRTKDPVGKKAEWHPMASGYFNE
ncbi:MAG TPA: Gfo/Idh/MocA family oxidoreductase [Flavisolibacter sp.]